MRTGFAISSFCLNDLPLEMALDRLSTVTDSVEIMDEGCHRLEDAAVLETFDLRYAIHAPSRGVNLASLLEPIRRASVEVTVACLALAIEVDAPVVVHPGYFAWPRDRKRAEQQFARSLQPQRAQGQGAQWLRPARWPPQRLPLDAADGLGQ